jgi:hypothetical protein
MLLGNLVKFKFPTVAKFCDNTGTHDFIIEDPLCGIVIGKDTHPIGGEDFLEILAAGEVLFGVDPDDVIPVKEVK